MDIFSTVTDDLNSLASDHFDYESFEDFRADDDDSMLGGGIDGLVTMLLRDDLISFFNSAIGSCTASDEALDSVHDYVSTRACVVSEQEDPVPRQETSSSSQTSYESEDKATKFVETGFRPKHVFRPTPNYAVPSPTEDIYAQPFVGSCKVDRPRRKRTRSVAGQRRAFRPIYTVRRRNRHED